MASYPIVSRGQTFARGRGVWEEEPVVLERVIQKTALWSDLATRRDSESDSEDSSSLDSLLSKVLEHAGEQSQSVDVDIVI